MEPPRSLIRAFAFAEWGLCKQHYAPQNEHATHRQKLFSRRSLRARFRNRVAERNNSDYPRPVNNTVHASFVAKALPPPFRNTLCDALYRFPAPPRHTTMVMEISGWVPRTPWFYIESRYHIFAFQITFTNLSLPVSGTIMGTIMESANETQHPEIKLVSRDSRQTRNAGENSPSVSFL